jgi:hypothetical protein
MRVFISVGNNGFWRFIPRRKVVCGQCFYTKHLAVQHCVNEFYFLHLIDGGMLHHQKTQRI